MVEFLEALLSAVDLPKAYRKFEPYKNRPVPEPPYLVYYIENERGYGADGANLIRYGRAIVELYTTRKNAALEDQVERAISAYEYDKFEDDLPEEAMLMVSYEFDMYQKTGGNAL